MTKPPFGATPEQTFTDVATPPEQFTDVATAPETPTEVPAVEGTTEGKPTPDDWERRKNALQSDLASERLKKHAIEEKFKAVLEALGMNKETQESPEETVRASRAETMALRTELALRDAIPEGVNRQALLDSSTLRQSLASIDTSDMTQVTEMVNKFVAANPWVNLLAAVPPGHRDASTRSSTTPAPPPDMNDVLRSLYRGLS